MRRGVVGTYLDCYQLRDKRSLGTASVLINTHPLATGPSRRIDVRLFFFVRAAEFAEVKCWVLEFGVLVLLLHGRAVAMLDADVVGCLFFVLGIVVLPLDAKGETLGRY